MVLQKKTKNIFHSTINLKLENVITKYHKEKNCHFEVFKYTFVWHISQLQNAVNNCYDTNGVSTKDVRHIRV